MRLAPSTILLVLLAIAALAVDVVAIRPAITAMAAQQNALRDQLASATAQSTHPVSNDQQKMAKRLQSPNDMKLVIGDLTRFRTAANLGDISYSLSPFTPQGDFVTQRVELTFTTPTDSAIWPFIQMAEDDATPLLRLSTLRITPHDNGVQASVAFINYRWPE